MYSETEATEKIFTSPRQRDGVIRYDRRQGWWSATRDDWADIFETEEKAVQALVERGANPNRILVVRRAKGTGSVYFNKTKTSKARPEGTWYAKWTDSMGIGHDTPQPTREDAEAFLDEMYETGRMIASPNKVDVPQEPEVVEPEVVEAETLVVPTSASSSISGLRTTRRLLSNRLFEVRKDINKLRQEEVALEISVSDVDMQISELINTHLSDGVRIIVEVENA